MQKTIKKCPCCESEKLFVKYPEMYDKDNFIAGKFSLIGCKNCSVEFVLPRLNEEELGEYYPKEYYSFNKKSKLAEFYHEISAYFYSGRNLFVGFFFSPFRPIFYRYLLRGYGKRVLEIGCGQGKTLEIYKKYGFETHGLEPYGGKITEREKSLGIERKAVREARFEDKFDLIVMKEVLEHVPEQEFVLKKCFDWLNIGGSLIITVPNTAGILNKIFGKNWYGYDVPRHVINYNSKNLAFFLQKIGFKIERVRSYEMPYMLDGSLKFYMADKNKKRQEGVLFSGLSKIICAPIALIISYLNLGSILEIECKK